MMWKGNGFQCRFSTRLLLAGCLALPLAGRAAEEQIVLKVRHDHTLGSCRGTLVLDNRGVQYETDHKKDARNWTYEDIKQLEVGTGNRIKIDTYEDRKWRLGADKVFQFDWGDGEVTAQKVYAFLRTRTRRPIAARLLPSEVGPVVYKFPVKHLGALTGSQGRLLFTNRQVVLESDQKGAARTWRYEDLESVSSAGLYDLTLTTYEQQKFHYASRHVYNFQLKEPLESETYDALWRFVNQKKGLELLGEQNPRQRVR